LVDSLPVSQTGSPAAALQAFSRAAGAASAITGLAVLVGWAFDIATLKSVSSGLATMKANTAICFVLAGSSLILSASAPAAAPARRVAQVMASGAALIGLLTGLEYMIGWDLGIDQALFKDPRSGSSVEAFPGRMAQATALAFVLVSTALIVLDVEPRGGSRPAQYAALLAAFIAFVAVIGHIYGVESLYAVAGYTSMAAYTAATLVLLSLGVVFARPRHGLMAIVTSNTAGGILARRVLPLAVLALPVLGWLRLRAEEAGYVDARFALALLITTTLLIVGGLTWWNATLLHRSDSARLEALENLRTLNAELEQRIADRTRELHDEIHGRQRTESALRLSEERLQAVVDHASAVVTLKDLEGRYLFVNRHFASLFGLPRDQLLGQRFQDVLPPATAEGAQEYDRQVLAAGGPKEFEEELRLADGLHTFLVIRFPLLGPDGVPYAIGTVATDITQRKRAEQAIQDARLEADRANQAKSDFLSRMSHELRTPLNAILGFGQLIEMRTETPQDRESVEQILKGGRHLLSLINEVLDISRIDSGRLSLSPEPVHVGEVIRRVVDLARPLASPRRIALQTEGLLTDRYVLADNQRLQQVLLNFVSNGIKYNHEGGRVTVACHDDGTGRLRISVIDTGRGIPAALQSRLFTPFDRLGAEAHGIEGTGLGLALSERLVEAMGGRIGLVSTEGRGSTFWVELSEARSPAVPVGLDKPTAPRGPAPVRSGTVLYVEDNPSNLRLVERVLAERPAVRLIPSMQGRLGLALAREHRPDLILVDLHLPDISGEEVLRELQADPDLKDTPVIIVSADATPGQLKRLLAAGARAYLTKPFDVAQLLGLLDATLSD